MCILSHFHYFVNLTAVYHYSDFDGIPDNEDPEPMKTNPDSGREVNYEFSVKLSDWTYTSLAMIVPSMFTFAPFIWTVPFGA